MRGHEWQSSIGSRTSQNRGCPYCCGQNILVGFNDLLTKNPELSQLWHPTKNSISPMEVTSGTNEKVWWLCGNGHEWITSVFHRTKNKSGCPYRSGQKLLFGFNDLASVSPEIAKEWHPKKNGNLQPSSVNNGTPEKAWWLDSFGHEWESSIRSRTSSSNRGCPYCAGKQVRAGYSDLATTHPSLAREWHPTKNGNILASMVTFGTSKKYWWICEQAHAWMSLATDRIRGNGCPKCSKRISKDEQAITDFLILQGLDVEQSNRKAIGKELDIYMPEKEIAVEYNGLYWHSERVGKGKGKTYHYDKWLAAQNAGIQLFQIWEDDWKRNPELIKNMLLRKLGISAQENVLARKTTVSKLVKSDVESFLNTRHIQGFSSGSYYFGLKERDTNNLVAVMTLRKAANSTLNIIRYATSEKVVGGFTKLLKYAELTLSPARFITSSDHCVSDGSLYANNGFIADKELAPDYRYVVKGERKYKSGYRLKRFREDPLLQWQEGLTEKELADLNNIPRIWDAGKTRWVKTVG